jgi:hypothetical protein
VLAEVALVAAARQWGATAASVEAAQVSVAAALTAIPAAQEVPRQVSASVVVAGTARQAPARQEATEATTVVEAVGEAGAR